MGLGMGRGIKCTESSSCESCRQALKRTSSTFAIAAISPARPRELRRGLCPACGTCADAHGLFLIVDEQVLLGLHRALMHAEDTQTPDERIGDHAEDVREHLARGVRRGVPVVLVALGRVALEELDRVDLDRARAQAREDVQQIVAPAPVLALTKQTGIRWPFSSAFSNAAWSFSGSKPAPFSPFSRYSIVRSSSTSITCSTMRLCASCTERKSVWSPALSVPSCSKTFTQSV